MSPLSTYLKQMHEIRSTGAGVDETSYYGSLEEFFNSIGKKLKPKVHCVMQLADIGAGRPDGGLFPATQSSDLWLENPDKASVPERGAIEVKPPSADVWQVARSKQVLDYLDRYGLVLVTNYRDFILVKADSDGNPVSLGRYTLAPSEVAFWAIAAHPRKKETKEQAKPFAEFLRYVMLQRAPLAEPEDLAWFLAFYARKAKARIESR
ncbi:DNA methyltransferase, partial [candidate division WOR-3 bacterium]|nr:DNA methyltransferase [candidate division WOR-3 bacterium]